MNSVKKLPGYQAIYNRLHERFTIMSDFTLAALEGDCRAMIVSGPAGLGKSYTVEQALKQWDPNKERHSIVKGAASKIGLMKMLYKHRFPNHAIVFDDVDSLFWDEDSMNLLKTVCDTCEDRTVSYLSEYKIVDEDSGDLVPSSFGFEGSVIFLTNLDFDKLIDKGNKISPHLAALVSRSHYLDLTLKSKNDYLVRIDQVVDEGMLSKLPKVHQHEILDFVFGNSDILRELSLRMVIKVANIRKMGKPNWREIAKVTCCRS